MGRIVTRFAIPSACGRRDADLGCLRRLVSASIYTAVVSRDPSTGPAIGCLALLALPFAAVGVVTGVQAFRHLEAWAEARRWVEVPAIVEWVELHPDYPRRPAGAAITTEDTPVRARYRYEFGGRFYKGERVWLGSSWDTVGSFHRDIHRELERHWRSGEPIACYVDPRAPGRSVLVRRLHWRRVFFLSVFCLVFGGAGFGLLALIPIGRRRLAEDRELEALHPDEPWLWKSEWRGVVVRPSSKEGIVFPLIFAVFWNLMSWLMLVVAAEQIFDPSNRPALLALLFPAVGVWLGVWAARAIVRRRKFGASQLELTVFPVPAGGGLEGRITTPWRFPHGVAPRLRLSCSEAGSKSEQGNPRVLWQRELEVPPEHVSYDGAKTAIPVAVTLPPDARESGDGAVSWQLEVEAAVAGVDYRSTFEIPVYGRPVEAAESASSVAAPGLDAPPPLGPVPAASGVTVEPLSAGGHRYVFNRARQKSAAIFLTFFFLIWTGFVYLLWRFDAPVFAALFALADLLVLAGTLDLWLTRRVVEADATGLAFRSGYLALGRRRHVPAEEIRDLQVDRGMQMGNKLYYRILLPGGKKDYTLADKLDSLALAERLVAWWRRDLAARD